MARQTKAYQSRGIRRADSVTTAILLASFSLTAFAYPASAMELEPEIKKAPDSVKVENTPASTDGGKLHVGTVVKTELQSEVHSDVQSEVKAVEEQPNLNQLTTSPLPSIDESKTPVTEIPLNLNLRAPVPGNQDGALPEPTFTAANATNVNSADALDDYSVTKNALSYPLVGATNSQSASQSSQPVVLRDSADGQPVTQANSKLQELPFNLNDAKIRLRQLKMLAAGTRPQDALENVNQFSRWLMDIVDAHNKMAAVFAKNEATKTQGVLEKQTGNKFSQLRFDAQLLKADLLIEEHRYPEALAPLVEIVIATPMSITGKTAYRHLQELGFSQAAAIATATTEGAPQSETKNDGESKLTDKSTKLVTSDGAQKFVVKTNMKVAHHWLHSANSRAGHVSALYKKQSVLRPNSTSAKKAPKTDQ